MNRRVGRLGESSNRDNRRIVEKGVCVVFRRVRTDRKPYFSSNELYKTIRKHQKQKQSQFAYRSRDKTRLTCANVQTDRFITLSEVISKGNCISSYSRMSHDRRWVWNESSHQGIYGTGKFKILNNDSRNDNSFLSWIGFVASNLKAIDPFAHAHLGHASKTQCVARVFCHSLFCLYMYCCIGVISRTNAFYNSKSKRIL